MLAQSNNIKIENNELENIPFKTQKIKRRYSKKSQEDYNKSFLVPKELHYYMIDKNINE